MSSEYAIKISGLSKIYPIYSKPIDRLKQLIVGSRRKYYREFRALDNVTLSIPKGITFGLLGQNGSGKSTLLQMLAGILQPTQGEIQVQGKIAALLELGAGFNPEFTGRENVFLNASLLGFNDDTISEIFPRIEAFADIGEFIDQPVKTYSSGMFARLAFAVASSVSPDILIIDEILAVGDAKFQARCFARLQELQKAGTTIILVTHSTEQIVTHCNEAAVLHRGSLMFVGEPRKAANLYLDILFGAADRDKDMPSLDPDADPRALLGLDSLPDDAPHFVAGVEDLLHGRPFYNKYEHRWGDGAAAILDVACVRDGEESSPPFESRASWTLIAKIHFKMDVLRPIFGFTLKTKEGVSLFGTNSELLNQETLLEDASAGDIVEVSYAVTTTLAPGDYFVSLGVASVKGGEVVPHDRRYDVIHIQIADKPPFYGITAFPFEMRRRSIYGTKAA